MARALPLPCSLFALSHLLTLIATLSFINRSELPLKKEQASFELNGGLILQGSAKTAVVALRMTVVCAGKVAQFFPKKNELSHGNQHAQTAGHEVEYWQSSQRAKKNNLKLLNRKVQGGFCRIRHDH